MNYSLYFVLEKKLKLMGFDFERHDLIAQFTDNKKSSLRELSDHEYKEFLQYVSKIVKNAKPSDYEVLNNMRRKLLAIFYKMGYTANGKTDVQAVDAWCRKYGRHHIGLNEMNRGQLAQVITQAETMLQKFIQSL